eukprot:gene15309-biopygen7078
MESNSVIGFRTSNNGHIMGLGCDLRHTSNWAVITGDNWTPLPLSSRYLSPVISRYRYPPLPLSPLPLPPVTCFLTVIPLPLSPVTVIAATVISHSLAGCPAGCSAAHNSSVSSVSQLWPAPLLTTVQSVHYGPLRCSLQFSQFSSVSYGLAALDEMGWLRSQATVGVSQVDPGQAHAAEQKSADFFWNSGGGGTTSSTGEQEGEQLQATLQAQAVG